MSSTISLQVDHLCQGCEEVISPEQLLEKIKSDQVLKIKAGFDPTAADLHFGHLVLLKKLRVFQNYGHQVIIVIGDYTGLIGDPSGRNTTRPVLSGEQIEKNALTYRDQVFRVLDQDLTQVKFNSQWCAKLTATDLIDLMQRVTVARIIERDDFKKRLHNNQSISLHELVYPLIQAYDSVVIEADVELGGSDLLFNLLRGRQLQQNFKQPQQVAMALPLLEGLDGKQKMSKSLDNYIALTDSADEMYGKLMSASDTLMWRYFSLISSFDQSSIDQMRAEVAEGLNPMECKFRLAGDMVTQLHGKTAAERVRTNFIKRFRQGCLPDDIDEKHLIRHRAEQYKLSVVLRDAGLVASSSEAIRQIRQNAVRIDQQRCTDANLVLQPDRIYLLQIGKRRLVKIKLQTAESSV